MFELSPEEALKKVRTNEVSSSGFDNWSYLKVVSDQESMAIFRDFVK